MPLAAVPDVDLDPQGTFKYILIKCTEKDTKEEKFIVRGYKKCTFHADIFDETRKNTDAAFKLKCVGGGRIRHTPEEQDLFVYGYSQGYGRADHPVAVDILKKAYPEYKVSFSNDGY